MKKALLAIILALSMQSFTQKQPWTGHRLHPEMHLNSRNNAKANLPYPSVLIADYKKSPRPAITFAPRFDSSYYWNNFSKIWQLKSKTIYTMDSANNITTELFQDWNGKTWDNYEQITYAYDANNNLVNLFQENWNGNTWEYRIQETFAYDSNNNLLNDLQEKLYDRNEYTYTYDANNNLLSELYKLWDGYALVNHDQKIYTYDINNNLTSILAQNWNGSVWDNFELDTFAYDASHNNINILFKGWKGNTWENTAQSNYEYNGNNNQISFLYKSWTGSTWENVSQTDYSYDANKNKINVLDKSQWDSTTSSWLSIDQYIYTYDAHNNLTNELRQAWYGYWDVYLQTSYTYDSLNNKISEANLIQGVGGDSTHYYYHFPLDINDQKVQETNISIYPNPCDGRFTINSSSPIWVVEVYNMLGEKIYSDFKSSRQTSNEIDLSAYSKGIYFIRIDNDGNIVNRKIVVQ